MNSREVVVIGVGNTFRRDDGAGPAVVQALARTRSVLPAHVRLTICDGEPTRLIDSWRGAGLAVIVDAVPADPDAGRTSGNLVRWEWDTRVGALVCAGDWTRGETKGGAETAGGPDPSEGAPPVPGVRTAAGRPAAEPGGTHTLGPGAAIGLARALDLLPSRLVVLAVVGDDFGQGPGLSDRVAAAVPVAAKQIITEIL